MEHYDAVVLGGGSGLTATWYAERDGKTVAVVEPGPLGGTCVNRGCIPTKTLLRSADIMRTLQGASEFGIHVDPDDVTVDFPAIFERMRRMREENVSHSDAWVDGSDAITRYRDRARFVDERTVELTDGTQLRGETIFVATGAHPFIPPVDGLEDVPYLTNRNLLDDLSTQPEHIVILGGGYIGLEFAHFFASVGSEVTVVESNACLLREDKDVRSLVTEEVAGYTNLLNGARATHAREEEGEVVLTVTMKETGEELEVRGDTLLVATGRRPTTEDLDLDAANVDLDERGFIAVDDALRTSNPHVYAYGDVIGQGMFKHTSSFEGEVAWRASQGEDATMSYRTNPHAIFTHPQVGSVGLNEEDAREQDHDVEVMRSEYEDVAKGEILGSPPGFAKLVYDATTERILGFHLVGPHAAMLIHEVVVAMNAGDGTVDNVADSIHVHPTMPELVQQVFQRAA